MDRLLFLTALVLVGICYVCASKHSVTPVEQCRGQNFDDLSDMVHITHCSKSRCKMRKGTNTTVTIHFKPKEKITDLVTIVTGNLGGLDLPFIGVTGNSACGQIKKADTEEAAPCPLEPDVEYIYTNTFHIEEFYPATSVRAHWSLTAGNKDLICFEVPLVILNK